MSKVSDADVEAAARVMAAAEVPDGQSPESVRTLVELCWRDFEETARAALEAVSSIHEAEPGVNGSFEIPPLEDREDGFECLAWHRGRWRHVRWVSQYNAWMFGYGSAMFHDLGRAFAPLPKLTPPHNFWDGENS